MQCNLVCPECKSEFHDLKSVILRKEYDRFGSFSLEYCPNCFKNRQMVALNQVEERGNKNNDKNHR